MKSVLFEIDFLTDKPGEDGKDSAYTRRAVAVDFEAASAYAYSLVGKPLDVDNDKGIVKAVWGIARIKPVEVV